MTRSLANTWYTNIRRALLAALLTTSLQAQETIAPLPPASPTVFAGATLNATGAALNATDEELQGILAPDDRANSARHWEQEIASLERLDRTERDPAGAVMLLGSSSIRLWDEAAESLSPYPVIRRGYGGARYSDLVVFARRLISPHNYRALIIFVGNDISGTKADRPIEDVRKMVSHVLQVAHEHNPTAPVLLIEVTPTPSRFAVWPETRKLNAMLRELWLTTPNVYFVSTAESYLTADDQPRPELFRDDRLHQNEAGYQIWAGLIRRHLDEVLN